MRTLLILIALFSSTFTKGHTSVQTINFPFGAENSALGEAGVAFAGGLSSHFYNPATGAVYGHDNRLNVVTSGFHEELLPERYLWNPIVHSSLSGGLFLPQITPELSLGIIANHHQIDFGQMVDFYRDSLGKLLSIDTTYAHEQVQKISLSLFYKERIALGVSLAQYYSKLDEGMEVKGWSTDLGAYLRQPIHAEEHAYLTTATGISLSGINTDKADYNKFDSTRGAPTPHTLRYGIALEGGLRNIVYGTLLFDIARELKKDRKGRRDKPIFSPGMQISFTPFLQLNNGFLIDNYGKRREHHIGLTIGYRHQRVMRFLAQTVGYQPRVSKRNFHILYSCNYINAFYEGNTVRDNQFSQEITLGIGFGKKFLKQKKVI